MTARRGQLVLLAAAVIAVAMVPMLFASLQLGYSADVQAATEYDEPVENAERMLTRAVHDATTAVEVRSWGDRSEHVSAVRSDLDPRLDTLESARVERGTVYRVAYNETVADAWRREYCPSGPDRQFGACEADRGAVVQERTGETHVLGVAFDVSVVGERRTTTVALRIRTTGER